MNFSFSAVIATIIKWFHDITMNHDERISALEANAGITPPPRPAAPPEVMAHVDAATPVSDGVVGKNGLKVLWKDYAGQMDRQAFPAIMMRIGRDLTADEIQAAYAAGIGKDAELAAATHIDYSQSHTGDDLGAGGGKTIQVLGVHPGQVVRLKFQLLAEDKFKAQKNLIVFGYPFVDFRNATFKVFQNGAVVKEGTKYANTGNAGSGYLCQWPVGDLPAGAYEVEISIDGSGDAGYTLNNA